MPCIQLPINYCTIPFSFLLFEVDVLGTDLELRSRAKRRKNTMNECLNIPKSTNLTFLGVTVTKATVGEVAILFLGEKRCCLHIDKSGEKLGRRKDIVRRKLSIPEYCRERTRCRDSPFKTAQKHQIRGSPSPWPKEVESEVRHQTTKKFARGPPFRAGTTKSASSQQHDILLPSPRRPSLFIPIPSIPSASRHPPTRQLHHPQNKITAAQRRKPALPLIA
ncbi:hypothetical protein B0J11DRAFT_188110 [Dendryphion nanum]|uniref:Uncharacterized protein n=1 Tax=Dendryphion nanum TaxID=256645 RepID=A0A9P9D3S6_9PLEO|nr:hypothetical protein B0J11DRAFT_188110 [Dendryphion nanum]